MDRGPISDLPLTKNPFGRRGAFRPLSDSRQSYGWDIEDVAGNPGGFPAVIDPRLAEAARVSVGRPSPQLPALPHARSRS